MTPEITALEQSAHAAIARIARSAYAAKKLHTVMAAIASQQILLRWIDYPQNRSIIRPCLDGEIVAGWCDRDFRWEGSPVKRWSGSVAAILGSIADSAADPRIEGRAIARCLDAIASRIHPSSTTCPRYFVDLTG